MPTSALAAPRAMPQPSQDAAPFLKWVGGKGRLLGQLRPLLPSGVELMRHVEPFVGGGALFFSQRPRRSLLADVNPVLIDTYTAVRDDVESVIGALHALARAHGPEAYYRVRDRFNANPASKVQRAAMFIYLNKTCFNGLYRVNRSGAFNVPAGRYAKPRILDPALLLAASHALRRAQIEHAGFEAALRYARPGDFVYFDPPYAPASPTANFTSYAVDGFAASDQERLRDVFRALDRRGCKVMLSNSDVPFVRELYQGFQIDRVAAPRAINCNAARRGPVPEVVVRNY